MPLSDISDEEALRLFQEDMRHCIKERKRQANSKVYTDRDSAFIKTTWNLMKNGSEDYWWGLVDRYTSRRVQILAGRGQLDLAAIQAIPAETEQDLRGWFVYLDLVNDTSVLFPCTGSSVSRDGGWFRLGEYEKVAQYAALGFRHSAARGAHLQIALQPLAQMHIRPLPNWLTSIIT